MRMKWIPLFSILFFLVIGTKQIYGEQKNIKVIVFDFGSVIAYTDRQQVIAFVAQSLNISKNQAQHAFQELKLYTAGEKDEQEFWTLYAKKNQLVLPSQWLEKLNEAKLQALKEIPGMINLVKDLQRQGYQTALLSNVRGSQAAIKRKLGLYHLFEPVLLSCEIGIKKPDPKAYAILLSRLKVSPQAVLFIDNKQSNVEAAQKSGMDGIVFVNSTQLIHDLKKRGITHNVIQNVVQKSVFEQLQRPCIR